MALTHNGGDDPSHGEILGVDGDKATVRDPTRGKQACQQKGNASEKELAGGEWMGHALT
jgi:hypothetical protein